MKVQMILIFMCAVAFNVCDGKGLEVNFNVTDEEYYIIPPVFNLDYYDACMNIPSQTLYCYTTLQLEPEDPGKPSESWRIIQELISVPRTYRHDKLRYGVCLPKTCPKIPKTYYSTGNGTASLHQSLSKCYTEIVKSHGLKTKVVKLKCEDKEEIYEIDFFDVVFSVVAGTLIFLTIIGTIYEVRARYMPSAVSNNTENHKKFRSILFAFSIRKNWESLRNANTSEIAIALSPIQGIRVYNMLAVIFCHTVMFNMYGPVQNTNYVEDTTLRPENMFVSNGALIIQTYFVISGWLLSYTFLVLFEDKRRVTFRHLMLAFANRYLRLAPLLLLVVGFNATWLRHFSRGPVWQHFVNDEFKNCRRNWWINMLFLNNYYRPHEMCLQQSWYIASDTQCFSLGLIVMKVILNKPHLAKKLFAGIILSAIITSIGISYYNEYDIVHRSYPETMYTIFLEDPQWLDTYIRGHFAIPSYVQGLAYGYWFYFMKKKNVPFMTSKLTKFIWLVFMWATPLTTVLIAARFYSEGFECSRLVAALYHGTYKYMFGMSIGIAILGFTMGEGGIMIKTVTWAPLQVLARISFSVYLVHVTVLRMKYGIMRSPVYLTDFKLFVDTIGDFWTSILCGTIVCLLAEMPIATLQKMITNPQKGDKNNNKDKKNQKIN